MKKLILLKVITAKNVRLPLLVFKSWIQILRSVSNGCHINVSNIVIITIRNVDCPCIINNISKSKAINLIEKSLLENCEYI